MYDRKKKDLHRGRMIAKSIGFSFSPKSTHLRQESGVDEGEVCLSTDTGMTFLGIGKIQGKSTSTLFHRREPDICSLHMF